MVKTLKDIRGLHDVTVSPYTSKIKPPLNDGKRKHVSSSVLKRIETSTSLKQLCKSNRPSKES